MAVPKALIITAVPKYVGRDGTLSTQVGIKLKARNSVLKCSNNAAVASKMAVTEPNVVTYMGYEDPQVSIPNRRRRLDHLTLEEKLQRK
jgi:hypothetical protein